MRRQNFNLDKYFFCHCFACATTFFFLHAPKSPVLWFLQPTTNPDNPPAPPQKKTSFHPPKKKMLAEATGRFHTHILPPHPSTPVPSLSLPPPPLP